MQVIEQYQTTGGGKGSWEEKPTVSIKAKEQILDKLDADASKWRDWKKSFLSYADTLRPGMEDWLKEVDNVNNIEDLYEDDLKEEVKKNKIQDWVVLDKDNLWRGVRGCTIGEARKITESTQSENGYEAWFDLCRNFEPAVTAKKGPSACGCLPHDSKTGQEPKGDTKHDD